MTQRTLGHLLKGKTGLRDFSLRNQFYSHKIFSLAIELNNEKKWTLEKDCDYHELLTYEVVIEMIRKIRDLQQLATPRQ